MRLENESLTKTCQNRCEQFTLVQWTRGGCCQKNYSAKYFLKYNYNSYRKLSRKKKKSDKLSADPQLTEVLT